MGRLRSDLERLLSSLGEIERAINVCNDPAKYPDITSPIEHLSQKISEKKEDLFALATLALERWYAPRAKPMQPPENMCDREEYKTRLEQYQKAQWQWEDWKKRFAILREARLTLSEALLKTYVSDCAPGVEDKLNELGLADWSAWNLMNRSTPTRQEVATYINTHSSTLCVSYVGPNGEQLAEGDWTLIPKQTPLHSQSASSPAPDRP
ncbi:MAG: hypothetical protein HY438_00525 [DPANN group archaeon]|nr:hypothetical protein [DPANN group archaeon]